MSVSSNSEQLAPSTVRVVKRELCRCVSPHSRSGDCSLASFKEKLGLETVASGAVDGRSVQGLRRASQRMLACKETRTEGQLLANYHKLVQAAEQLSPKYFPSTTEDDLKNAIALLSEEQFAWPDCVKYNIVMRRASVLLAEKKVPELMRMINPYAPCKKWDPNNPTLQSLDNKQRALTTWTRLLFQDLLTELLSQGEAGSAQVKELCSLGVQQLEGIDVVEIDNLSAQVLDEAMSAFASLFALLVVDLDIKTEARITPLAETLGRQTFLVWTFPLRKGERTGSFFFFFFFFFLDTKPHPQPPKATQQKKGNLHPSTPCST